MFQHVQMLQAGYMMGAFHKDMGKAVNGSEYPDQVYLQPRSSEFVLLQMAFCLVGRVDRHSGELHLHVQVALPIFFLASRGPRFRYSSAPMAAQAESAAAAVAAVAAAATGTRAWNN